MDSWWCWINRKSVRKDFPLTYSLTKSISYVILYSVYFESTTGLPSRHGVGSFYLRSLTFHIQGGEMQNVILLLASIGVSFSSFGFALLCVCPPTSKTRALVALLIASGPAICVISVWLSLIHRDNKLNCQED